ncbi:MAG: DUF3052 family protein [Acidimicrobiia bacterium]|nr:DUF3052 family protein [Acidimicrobiia bacterium]MBT8248706.1 DUF3052 family protein [Acidimicrobiia bacterium]NNL26880.1 DUF3052 family protein [Acidimicrobiia bacterium]NNL47546.1 DUF3052 family protein [Acidimicrobiia bacterium]
MLAHQIGIRSGDRVCLINPPVSFAEKLGTFPDGAELVRPDAEAFDIAVCFAKTLDLLTERFEVIRQRITPRGSLWLAWPSASRDTDISFNRVQALGLTAGMVDNQVAWLDDGWRGLRFVVRTQNREAWPERTVVHSQYSKDLGSKS